LAPNQQPQRLVSGVVAALPLSGTLSVSVEVAYVAIGLAGCFDS